MMTRPCQLTDPDKVQAAVNHYFNFREASQEVRELRNGDKRVYRTPPSVLGLCRALGISSDTFYRMVDDESAGNQTGNYNSEICGILRDAKDRISQELLEGVQMGFWNEKVTMAQLAKYGELGVEDQDRTIRIVMQGSDSWSD